MGAVKLECSLTSVLKWDLFLTRIYLQEESRFMGNKDSFYWTNNHNSQTTFSSFCSVRGTVIYRLIEEQYGRYVIERCPWERSVGAPAPCEAEKRREIYWLNEKLIDFSTFRQKSENSDNAKSYPHKAIKSSFSKPWDLGWKVQPNSSTDDMMSISVSVMTLSFVEVYSKNSKNQLWKISWIISSTITYKLQNSTYFAILETAGNR